jgi:hypothetical protein
MDATPLEETLRDLARESARTLAELGVRPTDEKWIHEHARTIASLEGEGKSRPFRRLLRRLRGK